MWIGHACFSDRSTGVGKFFAVHIIDLPIKWK